VVGGDQKDIGMGSAGSSGSRAALWDSCGSTASCHSPDCRKNLGVMGILEGEPLVWRGVYAMRKEG
jgi:hypothetical protein